MTFKESLVNFPSLPLPDTLPELHNIWLNKTAYLLINKLTVSFIMTHAAIIVSSHYYPLASLSRCSTAGHCVGMVAVKLPSILSAKGRGREKDIGSRSQLLITSKFIVLQRWTSQISSASGLENYGDSGFFSYDKWWVSEMSEKVCEHWNSFYGLLLLASKIRRQEKASCGHTLVVL